MTIHKHVDLIVRDDVDGEVSLRYLEESTGNFSRDLCNYAASARKGSTIGAPKTAVFRVLRADTGIDLRSKKPLTVYSVPEGSVDVKRPPIIQRTILMLTTLHPNGWNELRYVFVEDSVVDLTVDRQLSQLAANEPHLTHRFYSIGIGKHIGGAENSIRLVDEIEPLTPDEPTAEVQAAAEEAEKVKAEPKADSQGTVHVLPDRRAHMRSFFDEFGGGWLLPGESEDFE